MIVAISQPEHFPYEGFFQKMSACDVFVYLDDVQFSGPRSFQNRNRFINSRGEQEWFGVSVAKGSYASSLKDVRVSADLRWRAKVVRTLQQRYGIDFADVYSSQSLCEINIAGIEYIRTKMKITKTVVRSSDLRCTGSKSQKLANICRALGASTYLSGPGGAAYLSREVFDEIEVVYHHPDLTSPMTALDLFRSERTEECI
jgi:hypothetical protein